MSALRSPEDCVNDALSRLGSKRRVGSLFEGSDTAKIALDVYAQTRDETLRENDWDFAQAIAAAAVSGIGAPQPWAYSYQYPTDCLRVRSVFGADYIADKNNPLPNNWINSSAVISGNQVQVVLSNLAAASLVYTKRVTDPTAWEPLFTEAFCAALARRMAPGVAGLDAAKMEGADEQGETALAESVMG